ncbi:hypothetical protein GQ55_7G107200 [Panicum hallii var. hallii]|uniref:Uncharacterized protein n=1 Tax=Panicum hallii var. hallii TaxID=1504633 RepID=A0A2T7CTS0_9POAL|nr:hypothetical protein GQ55_7G107200 [Panicum hallii var. hallii]
MALNLSGHSAYSHVLLIFHPFAYLLSFPFKVFDVFPAIYDHENPSPVPLTYKSQCSSVSSSFRKFRARNNLLLYT